MYRIDGIRGVVRVVDDAAIPNDENNQDYLNYLLWLQKGGIPEQPASKSEKQKLQDNNSSYEKATQVITADYPQLEKDTWPTQDKESKAWVADPVNALTPWIDSAAATRGIDRVEYLRRTLAKAQQFEMVSSYLTGTRQKYEDQIKVGGDPVLDYAIPASLYAEMQAKTLQIMTVNATELQELF